MFLVPIVGHAQRIDYLTKTRTLGERITLGERSQAVLASTGGPQSGSCALTFRYSQRATARMTPASLTALAGR